jgi:glycosyltransferase involved in cell wall biosynthesis
MRGSHSFSLVFRLQLQALLREGGLDLHHQEQEYLHPGQHDGKDPGFSLGSIQEVDALLEPELEAPDLIYRLVSPSKLSFDPEQRLVSYLVTELGLGITKLAEGGGNIRQFEDQGGMIHTPSRWSKQRLVNGGFKPEHVVVIPNGVNPDLYHPMANEEVAKIRSLQGFTPEDVVLLNVGSPVWNKGLDILVQCFARLRQTHRHLFLILKDQSSVYGVGVQAYVQEILKPYDTSLQARALEGIRIIPSYLSFQAMRSVMNAADFYVSPYRAEGFNMPVLEAIACGTRPIVSAQGSTSDFCHADNALMIDGKLFGPTNVQGRPTDAHFAPHPDALIAIMKALLQSDPTKRKLPLVEREKSVSQFHWGIAARALKSLFIDLITSR